MKMEDYTFNVAEADNGFVLSVKWTDSEKGEQTTKYLCGNPRSLGVAIATILYEARP